MAVARSVVPLCQRRYSLLTGEKVGKLTVVTSSHAQEYLADVDTSDGAVGFAPGATHAGLQSIGAGTGQHFVDADDVVGVSADAEMETFFAGNLDEVSAARRFGQLPSGAHGCFFERRRNSSEAQGRICWDFNVLVCADTGSFEGFGG